MIRIDYPAQDFKTKKEGADRMIFDDIRKVWLRLTNEEWVRQNFVRFLVQVKQYPASLVAIEKRIQLGELMKRFDILVYSMEHRPWMMIECKAMEVPLDDSVLAQLLRYNVSVPVRYLVITNGTYCMAFEKRDQQLVPLEEFPEWGEGR